MRFWLNFSAGVVVLAATGLAAWYTSLPKPPEPPIQGIVLLLSAPLKPGPASIHDGAVELAIETAEGAYFSNSAEASKRIGELRMKRAVAQHRAYVEIRIVRPLPPTPEAYRAAAKVAAGLLRSEVMALYHPPTKALAPNFKETAKWLAAADPIDATFIHPDYAQVVEVNHAEPRLAAAEKEACRRFPEFAAAFAARSGAEFRIKAEIKGAKDRSEYIWVDVDRIDHNTIYGRLANVPVDLEPLKLGSAVTVPTDRVADWSFERNGKIQGRFTPPVIEQLRLLEEHSRK